VIDFDELATLTSFKIKFDELATSTVFRKRKKKSTSTALPPFSPGSSPAGSS
jgi:hypothetical protein